MSDPHVLTFEKDIENEIRSKSASLVDIASSSGVIQNKPENKVGGWAVLVFIMIFILVTGVIAYFYVISSQKNTAGTTVQTNDKKITTSTFQSDSPNKNTEPSSTPTTSTVKGAKLIVEPLSSVFPNVFPYIGNNLVKGEIYDTGYIITFTGYNTVYKTVLDNETLFTKDLIDLYHLDVGSSSPIFRDIKVGDLDARALIVPNGAKIYYSFIKPSSIVIADTDTLLQTIVSSILK